MKNCNIKYLTPILLLFSALAAHAQGVISCPADGKTDATSCLQSALNSIGSAANRQAYLQAGTYLVSARIIIPDRVQVIGVGRGDPGINTVIKASPTFPWADTVVQLGPAPGPDFNVQISNLTIDGSSRAGTCLSNFYAEELSWGRSLLLINCSNSIYIAGTGAQNSGPFSDLEMYPYNSDSSVASCIAINNVPAFRGFRQFTCNGGSMGTASAPGVWLNGGGNIADFHIEHFTTGLLLGSFGSAAYGMTVSGAHFGPGVQTAVQFNSQYPAQNVTVMSLTCDSCSSILNDPDTNHNITDNTLGFYMVGTGGGTDKVFSSSVYGLENHFSGRIRVNDGITLGPGNPRSNYTVSIYDATPGTGVTSVGEVAGANQGGTNLHEWRDPYNNLITTVAGDASLKTSNLQLWSTYTLATCDSTTRGSVAFQPSPSGTQDHLKLCAKQANDSYQWVQIY